ncbi:unnamed protein product [Rotaria sp. Silwood1]|nr:unnamed protein product [Rotaria sp. Silwood1]CAF1692305.1 unnamed protein product [Rotaria sp. Silwood1]
MEVSIAVYEYCLRYLLERIPSRRSTRNNRQNDVPIEEYVVDELYIKLKDYLKTYLEEICEAMKIFVAKIG